MMARHFGIPVARGGHPVAPARIPAGTAHPPAAPAGPPTVAGGAVVSLALIISTVVAIECVIAGLGRLLGGG